MLFGNIELQQTVLKEAQDYADKNHLKLVFGAMVGSISKGLFYADSDYDTRFLFLKDNYKTTKCIPWEMEEKELVYRHYPSDKVIYEWIPFWELTSFINFLQKPSFKDDFSEGLYNVVGWTFNSPFIWDPYGIQNKILPYINMIFEKKYELKSHIRVIEKYKEQINESKQTILAKSYLYMIHSALSIQWILDKNTFPPVYMDTLLLYGKDGSLYEQVKRIISDSREKSYVNYLSKKPEELHGMHFNIITDRDESIDCYILKMLQLGRDEISKELLFTETYKNSIIQKIFQVIDESIYDVEERELLFPFS